MADQQPLNRLGDFLRDERQWYQLPQLLRDGAPHRDPQRAAREEPPRHGRAAAAASGRSRRISIRRCAKYRTIDGTYNDLDVSADGSARPPLRPQRPARASVLPTRPTCSMPNPRVVSRELMTRDTFQPATILNLLAAAWIQFMVHDWFVHKRSQRPTASRFRSRRATTGRTPTMRVPRIGAGSGASRIDAPAGLRQPEQPLVGRVADLRLRRRRRREAAHRRAAASCKIEPTGLLPVDPAPASNFTGFTDNWWIGLAMLHTLFTLRAQLHLRSARARASDLERRAAVRARRKLINSALMAKIHTVEWTPAILPQPDHRSSRMHVNWYGLVGEELAGGLQVPRRQTRSSAASSARTPTITARRTRSPRSSSRSTGCTR